MKNSIKILSALCLVLIIGIFVYCAPVKVCAEDKKSEGKGQKEENITSSVKTPPAKKLIADAAKITLVDAINAAVANVKGQAAEAELENEDGYLVFTVKVITSTDVFEVKIDPTTSNIIKKKIDDDDDDNVRHNGKSHHKKAYKSRGKHREKKYDKYEDD